MHPLVMEQYLLLGQRLMLTLSISRLYDDNPPVPLLVEPGALPTKLDRLLEIPEKLPQTLPHKRQERFQSTPIYESLT
jgi:hypothetical protein